MPKINAVITLLCLVLIGCDSLGTLPAILASLKPDDRPVAATAKPMVNVSSPEPSTKSELYPSTNSAISIASLNDKKPQAKGVGAYTLNFDDTDLAEVAKVILGDSLGVNYVLSPDVHGKVTIQTTQAISKEQLLPTLEMILRMNNAALIKETGLYRIEPADSALYGSDINASSSVGYQTKVIPIHNVSVSEIEKVLKPLLKDRTILQTDAQRNILVVAGSSEEIQRVLEMVGAFDIDLMRGRSFALFTLANVEAEAIIKDLDAMFNEKVSKDDQNSSNFFRFIPIEHLNAVLAITHQAHYLRDIETWVKRLDKPSVTAKGGVNVYKVQHVDAVQLADTLNEIFNGTPRSQSSSNNSFAPTQETTEIASDNAVMPTATVPTGNAKVSNVGKVRIIADAPNNSIVIVSTPREYETIRPIIEQLDVMPLQVLIDATIVEVDLKNDLKYGMQWSFDSGNFHNLLTDISSGNIKNIGPVTGYSMFYSGGAAKAVLNALAEKSNINVIASPSLMVLNNQQGFINVGDKVPIATTQSTNNNSVNVTPTGLLDNNQNVSAIVSNNIQMVDTGVTLKITPRVNAGGLVSMKIEQEANQAVPTTTSTLNSPTIQQRKINSSIAVKNGETIVLGGLIREDSSKSLTGMPFLSDIPVLGSLFGTTTENSDKTELLILITPRVVQNEQNAKDVTNEFKRKLIGMYR